MKKTLFAFLLIACLNTQAQKTESSVIDSLQKAITFAENDTIKARLFNRLYNELSFTNVEEAMQQARIGLAHVQKMKWPKGIAVFQDNLGRAFSDMGNYDSTLFYYNAALSTHSIAKDKYNMSVTNNNLGTAAQNIRSDYTTAASYYFKALKLAEEMNDSTMLSSSLYNVARIYMLQKNYAKALTFDTKALRIREKKGTPDEIASSLESIGKIYSTKDGFYFQDELYLWNKILKAELTKWNTKKNGSLNIEFNEIISNNPLGTTKLHVALYVKGYSFFLSQIPKNIQGLDYNEINKNFKKPEDCEICGFKAVYNSFCECCENDKWESEEKNYFGKDEYVKYNQLDWEYDTKGILDFENSIYQKAENYKRLYSNQKLEEYFKEEELK